MPKENSVKVSIYEKQYSEIKIIAHANGLKVKQLINMSIEQALGDYEQYGYIQCNNRICVEDEESVVKYSLKVTDENYNNLKVICNAYDIKIKELIRQIILCYPYLIISKENECHSLIILYQLSKDIFNDELDKQKTLVHSYSRSLYKRVLKITYQIINLLNQDDYTAVPILTRTVIEAVVDISNIRDYGPDYLKYLKLIQLIRKYEFYNNYNDYCVVTNNEDTIDIDKIKDNIINEEKELLYELSKNSFDNDLKDYISKHIINGNIQDIDYRELKRYLTINRKLQLLVTSDDRKRNIKYKTWFYIMSQYTHNSIDFIEEYDEVSYLDEYKDLIGSLLKNGLIYLAGILDIKIKDENFKRLRKLKKKIDKDKGDNIDLWKILDLT